MKRYESPFGSIELTDERLSHILTFHPEVRPYISKFTQALANPEAVVPSKHDDEVKIFYHRLSPKRRLAIVVKTNARNFILTAYIISQ